MILERNKIKILIPYVGSLLVLCGYLKLSIIYGHFNIKISNYLEITEIFTLFLSDIVKYSLILGLIFIFTFIIESVPEKLNADKKNLDIVETDNFIKRLKKLFRLNMSMFLYSAIILLVSVYYFIWHRERFFEFMVYTCQLPIILLFTIILIEFKRSYKLLYQKFFDSTYNNLIIIVFLFSINVIQSAFIEIYEIEKGKTLIVSFQYNDNKIQSNDSLIYLGQTKNYLFMYDNSGKVSVVFPRVDLHDFKIKARDVKL